MFRNFIGIPRLATNKKPSCHVGRPYRIKLKASVRLLAAETKPFSRVAIQCYTRYGDAAISSAVINAGIHTVIRDGCRQHRSIHIAAKPLQIA